MRLLAIITVVVAQITNVTAGSMFGPPPFTNGSPLPTGVQGTYQATAVGQGISGIIRFSYNANGNPSALGVNNYIFFVNGTIVTGQTDASIMTNKIYGVLDTPNAINPPPTLVSFDALGGSFKANINTKSPTYSFSGNGELATFIDDGGGITSVNQTFAVRGMRTSLNDE